MVSGERPVTGPSVVMGTVRGVGTSGQGGVQQAAPTHSPPAPSCSESVLNGPQLAHPAPAQAPAFTPSTLHLLLHAQPGTPMLPEALLSSVVAWSLVGFANVVMPPLPTSTQSCAKGLGPQWPL